MNNELIVVIVNSGFADDVMEAARSANARGGTVINGRGTARKEAEKMFNISIQPEKEVLLILVDESIKHDVLHSIYKKVGLNTPGQGIAFTLPVSDAVGIFDPSSQEKKEQ